jgi:hypothetical protein
VTEINPLIPLTSVLLGGLLTYLGLIHSQHITTARERETRLIDQEAQRLRAHNRFQAKTLIKAQQLAARLVERTVTSRSLMNTPPHLMSLANQPEMLDARIEKANEESWNALNELALIRERIVDDDLRSRLAELGRAVGRHRHPGPSDNINSVIADLDKHFHSANDRLGEILRKLI